MGPRGHFTERHSIRHDDWSIPSGILIIMLYFSMRYIGTKTAPLAAVYMAVCNQIEPAFPADPGHRLEDLVYELVASASALAGQIHPLVAESMGDLVRSMNCYYSNLIEGHNTVPRDIERALAHDYSSEPHKRDLQLE